MTEEAKQGRVSLLVLLSQYHNRI